MAALKELQMQLENQASALNKIQKGMMISTIAFPSRKFSHQVLEICRFCRGDVVCCIHKNSYALEIGLPLQI